MTELHELLDRATDRIEGVDATGWASSAMSQAGVVRRRRRLAAAAGVAAAIVAGFAVVSGVSGSDRADPPIAPSSEVPAVPESAVQPVFDPGQADSLPFRDVGLPETMVPPADVPALPMDEPAAWVVRGDGATLFLLTADGDWATTETPSGDRYRASLSPDGTRLASVGEEDGRLFVTDVRDGAWREISVPAGMRGLLSATIHWLTTDELVIWSGGEAWTVPLDGSKRPAERRMPTFSGGYTIASDALEISFGKDELTSDPVIVEMQDGAVVRRFGIKALGSILRAFADEDRVVAMEMTAGDDTTSGRDGIIVFDRDDDYTPTHFLPLDGYRFASPMGWLDDATALLLFDTPGNDWVVVAWEIDSGELTRVTSGTSEVIFDP